MISVINDARNRIAAALPLVIALGISLPLPTPVRGDDQDAERVRPRYQRDAPRPAAEEAPPSAPLPPELIPKAPPALPAPPTSVEEQTTGGRAPRTTTGMSEKKAEGAIEGYHAPRRPAPVPPGGGESIDAYAERSAAWAAGETARTVGWLDYYRIGTYEGMRRALNDPLIGRFDYRQGVSLGRRDPQALSLGSRIGSRTADELAAAAAVDRVSSQFMDLSRDPRYAPRAVTPAWTPVGSWAIEPDLHDVFDLYPPAGRFPPDLAAAFRSWRYDPWALYRCGSWREFHDRDWADPGRALELFRSNGRLSAPWRAMSPADRRVFDSAFRAAFLRQLPRFFDMHARKGYERGFADGWSYGAFVRQEWQFRLGYNQGFDESVISAALAGFDGTYPRSYEEHYSLAFGEWSTSPRPAVISVTLLDGNDDGVFEPGEEILAAWEVANYGGREGLFTLAIAGRVLDRPVSLDLMLPARRTLRSREPLRAFIDPAVPPKTASQIEFDLADSTRRLDLLVSYPVEFAGGATLGRVETLAGRATLVARVANRSRRDLTATLDLDRNGSFDVADLPRELNLRPGETRPVEISLDGLSPLDLLDGNVRIELEAGSGSAVHDTLVFGFPALGRDLQRRDLLDFMIALSRDENARAGDIARTRALLLERLRADWNEAARGAGNPYRDDYADNGSVTALGELVRVWQLERRSLKNSAVFEDLDDEIRNLADDLPGIHPFLRKGMKKLAGRLA